MASVKQEKIDRTPEMNIVAYYLAICARIVKGKDLPPPALGVEQWQDAYRLFYEPLGEGRNRKSFCRSIAQLRAVYVRYFNGDDKAIGPKHRHLHNAWKNHLNALESLVLSYLNSGPSPEESWDMDASAQTEGGRWVRMSRYYERSREIKEAAKAMHGVNCMACGFNFEQAYGEWGAGFIVAHHAVPLSQHRRRAINPKTDMVVLCANCHRMVHRHAGICLTLKELKAKLARAAKANGVRH